ncbi:MAG: IscS subfamily cysteine desulfurase [Eubacteriales bacterium]
MIYLDNAATTAAAPEVVQAMLPYFTEHFGNPSAVSRPGAKAKSAITKAREQAARVIGVQPDEIYFTSGGTEADNQALSAVFDAFHERGNHIITSAIEHPAILRTCAWLEKERGARVTYLSPDSEGFIRPEDVEAAITDQTILVSVMTANNEIGTIQPVSEIGKIAHNHGILMHTDAVQAFGQIPLDAEKMNVDLLSASGHKFNGPKGTGILYIRRGVQVGAFIHGGAQEHNRRAGTENVPGIVGFGVAAERALQHMPGKIRKETELRNYLISRIREEIPFVRLNGPDPVQTSAAGKLRRLPGNVNFSFEFAEGESVVIMLDMRGICVSSGSACSSGSLSPSHVLKAIGLSDDLAKGAVRMTLSEDTTKEELDETVSALKEIISHLRSMSTAYEACQKGLRPSETGRHN